MIVDWLDWLRYAPPPGYVPEGHPGLTPRVVHAVALARLIYRTNPYITDENGPHLHHWQPILWWCRGCGEFDPPD
jgi:hypothetical protein